MRSIIWGHDFSEQVEQSGGALAIDEALAPIVEALMRNPYGFPLIENDYVSFRYARTEPIPNVLGALIVVFTIDIQKNVVLEWLEEDPPF